MEVNNLQELIAQNISGSKKIKKVSTLKNPRQGYGSLMLKIEVTLTNGAGDEEILHLVAKKIPIDEKVKQVFDIQNSFKKEVAFYNVIVPILKQFQEENGVTDQVRFAKFYGARYNLHGENDVVDDDAILLLEDLSVEGFTCKNGLEEDSLKMEKTVLLDLAKFHGTVMALKSLKPDIFEEKILPNCTPYSFCSYPKFPIETFKVLRELISTFPECSELAEKATNFPDKVTPATCREPFGVLAHYDLKMNNIMQKTEKDGTIKIVLVDFQIYSYRSPAADIFFFLWTNLSQKKLEENLDRLLKFYHQSLLSTLDFFNIDTSKFDYDYFEEELRQEANFEFGHALMFNYFMKHDAKMEDNYRSDVALIKPELREFVNFMVKECNKRGWL